MRQTNRLRCDDLLDAALVVYEQSPDLTAITHAMVREDQRGRHRRRAIRRTGPTRDPALRSLRCDQ